MVRLAALIVGWQPYLTALAESAEPALIRLMAVQHDDDAWSRTARRSRLDPEEPSMVAIRHLLGWPEGDNDTLAALVDRYL